jgi:hypothetical protein
MDRQLEEADHWLRKNGFNYQITERKRVGGTDDALGGRSISIEPVTFDAQVLEGALQKTFGDPAMRPLSAPDVEKLLAQYLKENPIKRSQDAALVFLKIQAQERKYDREGAKRKYKELIGQSALTRGRPRSV